MDSTQPHPQRMAIFAVTILEEAAKAARFEPIKPTVAHRLALAWLAYIGLSEPLRTETFWKLLRTFEESHRPDGQYCRESQIAACLNGWRRLAGMPEKLAWWE